MPSFNNKKNTKAKSPPPLSEETTKAILAGLAKADTAATERGKGKDLVLVVGNTGAGKSTFVNYIMGKNMREERVPGDLEKGFVCDNPVMEIGHGFESKTEFPESCSDDSTNLTYCDCPGFLDNRGVVFDITNMYAMTKMAQTARSVKGVVIIFNYYALKSERARGLREMACLLDTIFSSKAALHKSSVMLLVTRVPSDIALGDLRGFLSDAVNSGQITQSDDSHRLFQHLARTCEFYDPLDRYCESPMNRLSRLDLIQSFKQFSGIPHHSLEVGLSNEAINTLSSMLTALQDAARENFSEQNIDQVICFLATIEGLRVLRTAAVEQCYGDFKQFMITQLHAWSKDLEMMPAIQDIGVKLPLIGEQVDVIVAVMVKEIEEKKAMGEKIDVMESELDLAKKEVETKILQNSALEAENRATKAKNEEDMRELQRQEKNIKRLEDEIEKSKSEASKLRSELSRPPPDSGLSSALLSMLIPQAFASGGGMGMGGGMYGGGGMGMGGMMDSVSSSFGSMSMGPSRSSSMGSSGSVYHSSGSANGRTIYTGPRGGQYIFTRGGNKRYI